MLKCACCFSLCSGAAGGVLQRGFILQRVKVSGATRRGSKATPPLRGPWRRAVEGGGRRPDRQESAGHVHADSQKQPTNNYSFR